MRQKDGAVLFDLLEKERGVWTDSCVEDQIRCVISFANDPSSNKQWFDFKDERKKYPSNFLGIQKIDHGFVHEAKISVLTIFFNHL
ncbi:helix-hairpin-helix domain-containing protein [Mesobacillus zeae]|uniref:helix-hairpin-helix domain-containing protein n=1 Tax=Mesobacillus zeae TaxID=1917180 RepID=UPI001FE53C3D|nr:helix-hairpin-helix domain-containing protein [Mesobacillus zeae]